MVRLHSLFSRQRNFAVSHIARGFEAVPPTGDQLDVVLVTVKDCHLLADIETPPTMIRHHVAEITPTHLGFECHRLVREAVGHYDYYAYLEDDLIIHDPGFFDKLTFFNRHVNDPLCLLQPHRYELCLREGVERKSLAHKVYNDYRGSNVRYTDPQLRFNAIGRAITIERSTQPHAGCWFLNPEQARLFTEGAHWGWRNELLWNSPLDTAATLGISRTFRIYKTALDSLDFFELQHACPIVMKQVFPADGPVPAWIW